MNSSTTVTKIAGALLKAQKEMGDVTKSAKNPFYKSTFADLNSIREVVIPALNIVGVAILQPTITLGDRNFVETILLHESGEFISGITEIKNGDGKPQSEGSGISYARRYGLQSMLNVGAVDDDGEAAQGRKVETTRSTNTGSGVNKTTGNGNATVNVDTGTKSGSSGKAPFTEIPKTEEKKRPIKEMIESRVSLLDAQKKLSIDAFKTNYLGGKKFSTIAPSDLPTIYEKLNKDFPVTSNGGK